MTKKVLILGNYRHTLVVIRSLHQEGYEVILGKENKPYTKTRLFTEYSKFVARVWSHPSLENEADFMDTLKHFTGENNIDIIFPLGENFLSVLAKNVDSVRLSAKVVMPTGATVLTCLNKYSMYKLLAGKGLIEPSFFKVDSQWELEEKTGVLGYPQVLKPVDSLSGRIDGHKAVFIKAPADVDCILPHLNYPVLLQKEFFGARINCMFSAKQGEVIGYFEDEVLRTTALDGAGNAVDSVSVRPCPYRKAMVGKILQAINYSGVGCVQFIVDRNTNEHFFLELNPRLDANCALPFYLGVNFPLDAIHIIEDEDANRPHAEPYLSGKRIHWLAGDIEAFKSACGAGKLSPVQAIVWFFSIIKSSCKADFNTTWQMADPMPTLIIFKNIMPNFRKLFSLPYGFGKKRRNGVEISTGVAPWINRR